MGIPTIFEDCDRSAVKIVEKTVTLVKWYLTTENGDKYRTRTIPMRGQTVQYGANSLVTCTVFTDKNGLDEIPFHEPKDNRFALT